MYVYIKLTNINITIFIKHTIFVRERKREKRLFWSRIIRHLKKTKKVIEFGQGQAASMLKALRPNFCGLVIGCGLGVMRSWC